MTNKTYVLYNIKTYLEGIQNTAGCLSQLMQSYIELFPCQQLLLSYAGDLCKQFRPRSGPTECWSWSGSKLLDTLIVFVKEFFEFFFLKKVNQQEEKHEKLPSMQRVKVWTDVCTKIVFHVPVPRLCKMQHICQIYLYTFTFIIKYWYYDRLCSFS